MAGEKGTTQGTVRVLECDNEGGAITWFVGCWVADPARFLSYFEGGVGGVVGNEGTVALVRGPGTAAFAYSCWDAVNENFGPFDIGPCLDDVSVIEILGVCFPK